MKISLPCLSLDFLFGCDERGHNISIDPRAEVMARGALGLPSDAPLAWDVPPVFDAPYASTFAASATSVDGRRVEFHLAE